MALVTNVEFVTNFMEFSPFGAMSQLFVMDALYKQAKLIVDQKEELINNQKEEEKQGKISLINMESWVGVAEDYIKNYEETYT